jgi:hypothetical protein
MANRKTQTTYSSKTANDIPNDAQRPWIGTLVSTLSALAIIAGLLWYIHSQIVDFDAKIAAINGRLDKLDSSVKIIADKQGGDTGNAVHEILGAALRTTLSGSQQQQTASALVHSAKNLIGEMQLDSSRPTTVFFENSAKPLSQIYVASTKPDLKLATVETMSSLAELRSSTDPMSISVSYFDYGSSPPLTNLSNLILEDKGAPQPIENVHWKNVEVRNATVIYSGGPLILENVRFVNCKFKFSDAPKAFNLLNIAVLGYPAQTTSG